ncbi:MAG: GIY-YIG nuclease family protein [Candidatus Cloacimonetes bacterium]|nr:GIY-YIG nuclease family protein [Candidatus Cloacimonadota bacterium]
MGILEVGKYYKNLKEICAKTGIEYKDNNNGRKAIIKQIERFYLLERDGNGYWIKEKYDVPKDKIDNRKNNSGHHRKKYYSNFNISEENENKIGVYTIILDNKIYIGSTIVGFRYRFKEHIKFNNPLPTKYMLENGAKFSILEICDGLDEPMIREIENQYIQEYKNNNNWYVVNKRDAWSIRKLFKVKKVKMKYKTIKIKQDNYEDAIKLLTSNGLI